LVVSFVENRGHRILVTDRVSEAIVKGLSGNGFEVSYRPDISYEELLGIVGEYHILVIRGRLRIDREVINRGKELRLIVRVGSGLDNIDLETAKEMGVEVINTPEAPVISVAELVIGLMIMCSRDLYNVTHNLKNGAWIRPMGTELYGKTLCIVGLGRIGSRVAMLARSLGMRVLAHDILDLSSRAQELGAEFYRDLHSMLPNCDYISLHIPLDSSTRRMFSRREFFLLRRGCVFINTSRGGVIDPEALLEALESGVVRCAALDVFEREPPEPGSVEEKLIKHERVIPTPHIGFQTLEAQERGALITLREILRRLG